MKHTLFLTLVTALHLFFLPFLPLQGGISAVQANENQWHELFDGKTLAGWTAKEHPESFAVEDGSILCTGERAHLYYTGPIGNMRWKNFELKVVAMTEPGSNSGIYFHTFPQESGWPKKGFEVQINNSGKTERRMTGSLYNIIDVMNSPVKDNEWFEIHIIVKDKTVRVFVDGEQYIHYDEPEPPHPPDGMPGRVLSAGTIALQAHDPLSFVYFKSIKVRLLDEE